MTEAGAPAGAAKLTSVIAVKTAMPWTRVRRQEPSGWTAGPISHPGRAGARP